MGATLQPVFGDANAGLVATSILLETVAVAATYLLGRAMFTPGAGLAAALMLVASVTFWTYGGTALAYPALATFGALTALFAYQTLYQGRDRLMACAGVYAIGTGFRPDLALFLLPLLIAACHRQPFKRIGLALAVAGAGVLLWLVPTALLSSGFGEYWATFAAYAGTDVLERYAPAARGVDALAVNLRDTGQYLFFALYFEAAVVAAGLALLVWRRAFTLLFFLGIYVAPMVLFYLLLHIGDPGYVFGLLPALLVMGAGGVARWLGNRGPVFAAVAPALLALVLTANVLVFAMHERPLTLSGLRAKDLSNGARLAYISAYRPEEVFLVSYDSYKHFRYYLPDYVHSVWLDTTTPTAQVFPIPSGVRWALLTDPSVFALVRNLPAEAEPLPGDAWVAKLPVQSGQSLVYEGGNLRVAP